MMARGIARVMLALVLIGLPSPGVAATLSSGSTGADGAFNPPATVPPGTTVVGNTVTVPLPPSGVFNFSTITIPAGITVQFAKNAANTPVTLLASGDATIAGTLNLDGQPGKPGMTGASFIPNPGGVSGPGGFDGGAGGGNGLGPGGGGGGLSTLFTRGGQAFFLGAYGTPELLPLIGGSGGGGGSLFSSPNRDYTPGGGGGGGGALLVATSGTLTLTGTITARGGAGGQDVFSSVFGASNAGGGGGSGGAVRLVAPTLAGGGGTIDVGGGTCSGSICGGEGRVRLEGATSTATLTVVGNPFEPSPLSSGVPGVTVPTGLPGLRIASVGGVAVPAAPTGAFATPDITLPITTASPVTVVVTATGVPDGTPVVLRGTPQAGPATTAITPGLAGGSASASLSLDLLQPNVITAEATYVVAAIDVPVTVAQAAGDLDPVTHIRVAARFGGESDVIYVTRSGRRIPAL